MQSTHNTIGSQIALLLQCQGYNQTYVHDAFSFEHALLDTLMQMEENPDQHILTGGVDEYTNISHGIHTRFNIYRDQVLSSLEIIDKPGDGTVHGEGAAWFVLSGTETSQSKAVLKGVRTYYQPSKENLQHGIRAFVSDCGINENEIDLILLGKSGDRKADNRTDDIIKFVFPKNDVGVFKHLCGEHCAASAFAMWLGTKILEEQKIPPILSSGKMNGPIRNVLIYNPYFYDHHSLIMLTSCRDSIG
jgi:3-oxoacyl-(acyl-carrier-protein) synthase